MLTDHRLSAMRDSMARAVNEAIVTDPRYVSMLEELERLHDYAKLPEMVKLRIASIIRKAKGE